MSQKQWSPGSGTAGTEQEWSVHARLTITSPVGLPSDSGYGSEPSHAGGRRATCSVTLSGAGPHYVTLTCADPPAPPPQQCCAKASKVASVRDVASQTSFNNFPPSFHKKTQAGSRRKSKFAKPCSSKVDDKKAPRTVHIDVYCTGSESESSSEDTASGSSAQTVFESSKVRVVHTRVHSDRLPNALQRQKRRILSDGSAYASDRSSLISLESLSLPSESTFVSSMMSSGRSTTSWKDTDVESSRYSLAVTDSFDYENSTDKLRIKEKEQSWAARTWKSPDLARRVPLRQKKMHKKPKDEEDSDSSETSDDETEMAWSFGRYEELENRSDWCRPNLNFRPSKLPDYLPPVPPRTNLVKSGSLSDTESSSKRTQEPSTSSHLSRAEKFGSTIRSSRRPGHHIGPSKNPDCSCETCRYFFENVDRNRSRSLSATRNPSN